MKKLSIYIILPVFWAGTLMAAGDRSPEKAVNVSFEQLLNRLTGGILKDISLPEPGVEMAALEDLKNDDRFWVTVSASDKYARTALLEIGLDIAEVNDKTVSGFIHKQGLDTLSEKGYVVLSRQSIYDYARQYLKDFPAADSAYHNYKETADVLKQLAAANQDIASLFSIGKTVEGRDIWCLRLNTSAKGDAASSKPGAFYIGNHHAREHLSNEVPLLFAAYLLEHRNDADIKSYLSALDIYIVPMLNGDGVEYDIAAGKYRWQRKNTRVNPDKSIGVDLNRNYDALWCKGGASHSPSAETYCGPSAFSEPETQAVKKFAEARGNLKTLMSYHSYSSLLLYPWGGKAVPVENARDRQVFEKMGAAMAGFTGYKPEQASDLYVATGDTCDWAYAAAGIFAFTTELEGNGFYPGVAIIDHAVSANIKAALYMLSVTDNPYKLLQ
ncbi:MAG: M14 family metallopeptidase [Elusimicrobia bacterium]|nr:M14 family metallopeptidase [Elusimicrobiota bacterium]